MLFLIVDDDPLSRELLTLLLQIEGYAVEAAASGDEAISRLEGSRDLPTVILADIQMPGIAGDVLARALRSLVQPETLLLAMSGSQPAPDSTKSFDGFLLKPFKITELQSMISEGRTLAGGRKDPVTETSVAESTASDAAAAQSTGRRAHGSPRGDATSNDGVLDDDIYAKLRDLMPLEQLGQMYALCMEDSRKRIVHMRALAAARDDVEFRREAHAVKGGCGMIGATELYLLSEAAERDGLAVQSPAVTPDQSPSHDAPATRTSDVTAMLDQLALACDRLERILMEHMRE